MSRRLVPSPASTTNRARCCSGSHSSTDGGRRNPVWRSIVRKLFIGTTFAAMENHRTDSIPNDSYPVKSDRLLERCMGGLPIMEIKADGAGFGAFGADAVPDGFLGVFRHQLLQLCFGRVVVEIGCAGPAKHPGKFRPGIG